MRKKLLSVILATAMVGTMLAGCGSSAKTEETAAPTETTTETKNSTDAAKEVTDTAKETVAEGGLIGVAMPTKDLQRWNQDGENMKAQLEKAGYQVDLQYASNDVATQVSQIENMISNGCKLLVIASIDGSSLGTPLASAKDANIPVIAYDRLIMNSDAVSYYATFDNYMVGTKQGEYIVKALDLENAAGPFNLEVFILNQEN
jgi:putative multiple sugar transport system substrate-binding protein